MSRTMLATARKTSAFLAVLTDVCHHGMNGRSRISIFVGFTGPMLLPDFSNLGSLKSRPVSRFVTCCSLTGHFHLGSLTLQFE